MPNTTKPKQPRKFSFKAPQPPASPEWMEREKLSRERILKKYGATN